MTPTIHKGTFKYVKPKQENEPEDGFRFAIVRDQFGHYLAELYGRAVRGTQGEARLRRAIRNITRCIEGPAGIDALQIREPWVDLINSPLVITRTKTIWVVIIDEIAYKYPRATFPLLRHLLDYLIEAPAVREHDASYT